MEERIKISILLDYYGMLLTDKQLEVMDLYYNDDLSLSEISELHSTSRQAIHDLIKRCNKLLLDYEQKLNLMKDNFLFQENKKEIVKNIEKLKLDINSNICSNELLIEIENIKEKIEIL